MQFQNQNPEMEAPPPGVAIQTPLGQMRRMQLEYLAKAFGIEGGMNFSLPKSVLMPLFESAEQRGVFKGTPVKPWLLARVQWPDEPEKWPAVPQTEVAPATLDRAPFDEAELPPRAFDGNTVSWNRHKEHLGSEPKKDVSRDDPTEAPATLVVEEVIPLENQSMAQVRAAGKKAGINAFQKSKAAIIAELNAREV